MLDQVFMAYGICCETRRGLSRFPSSHTHRTSPNVGGSYSSLQSFKKARPGTLAQTVDIGLDTAITGEHYFMLRGLGTEKSNSTPRGLGLRDLIAEKAIPWAGLWIRAVEVFSQQLAGMEPSFRGLVKSVTLTPKGRKEFAGTGKPQME